jgi:hypothetical protein
MTDYDAPPINTDSSIAKLVVTKPEAEIALEFKREAEQALLELCRVMDRAGKAGFVVGFQLGQIPPGKNILQHLHIAKQY